MKRPILFLPYALIAYLMFSGNQAVALTVGDRLPAASMSVAMKGVDGQPTSIGKAAGAKGTLVIFTCNACPYVKAWEDRIAQLGNDYRAKGVGVIAINANDPAKVAEDGYDEMVKRAKAKGFQFPYVVDETSGVARAFGATRTPEVYLFDAANKLVYSGAIDDNSEDAAKVQSHYLKDALDKLTAGKAGEIKPASTKAIGCTIKWRAEAQSR